MFEKSYLKSSRQIWKLYLAFILMLIGFTSMMVALKGNFAVDLSLTLIVGGLGLWALSFAWVCLAVRCGKCKAKLVWKAMREQSYNDWLPWLMSLRQCPVCQHGAFQS
jgi:hypothetical protein